MKKLNVLKRVVSLFLCAALLLSNVPLTINAAGSRLSNSANEEADSSTADSWKSMLGTTADGNRYSGRIWTDKSVFTGNSVALGDTGIGSVANNSEFMVVYSALGSTTSISTTKTTVTGALDVVIVLDDSMSMGYAAGSNGSMSGNGSGTRLQAVTKAANGLVKEILGNANSRLAVVTYAQGAETLLPLDYYKQNDGRDVLSVSGSGLNGKMQATAVSKTTNTTINNTHSGYTGNTNLQAGIDLAMDILLNERSTTGRAPVIIVLTDGVADSAVDQGWWEVETNTGNTDGDTVSPFTNTITAGVALSTLLNAAYKTSKVEEKYGVNPSIYGIGVDLGSSSDAFVVMNPRDAFKANGVNLARTAYDWYTQWYNGTDYTQTDERQISWDFRLPSGLSSAEQAEMKAAVQRNINYIDAYYNVSAAGTALEDAFVEIVEKMNQEVFHPITDTVVVGGEVTSTPLTYVDFIGDYMEVKKVNKVTVFGREYNVVAGLTATKETSKGDGTYEVTATTTYIVGADGDMITNAIMGTTASINECIKIELIETYTAVQTDNAFEKRTVGDQQLWVYINENALPLICDEVTDKDGQITYKRTEAQPVRVYYEVGVSDDIKATDGTVMVSRISAEYLEKNTDEHGNVYFYAGQYGEMNGSKVVDKNGYVINETEDGKDYFYRTGDAHASATPSKENRYYFHLANQGIFTDVERKDGGSIQWGETEYGVIWEEDTYDLTWMTYAQYVEYNNILANNKDVQVHTYVNFYSPVQGSNNQGKKVTYLVYAGWSQLKDSIAFYDNANGVYINYAPETNSISVGETGNYIDPETLPSGVSIDSIISRYIQNVKTYVGSGAKTITAADIYAMLGIGSLRMPRLSNMAREKEENNTGTAYYAYVPTRAQDDGNHTEHIGNLVIWLGNNGRLALDPTQGLALSKSVKEASDQNGAPTSFTFEVTLRNATNFDGSAISAMDGYGNEVNGWTVSAVTENSADGYTCKITGTLKDGETAYLINLPAGATYSVVETNAGDYYNAVFTNGSGIIVNNQITAVNAVNDAKEFADLYITKEIVHAQAGHVVPANVLRDEAFTVSVDFGTALAGKRFDMVHSGNSSLDSVTVDADGVNEFVIKHGETIQIIDLPVGAEISVTETEGAGNGTNYIASYRSRNHSGYSSDDNGTVTIMVDGDSTTHDAATVVVRNAYTPKSTSVALNINGTKNFTVENETLPAATFNFEVQAWNGNEWVGISGKTASVTYTQGESEHVKQFAISNVLENITYSATGYWAYRVVEVIPTENVSGVTYDRTLYTFGVTVTDNHGELVAKVTGLQNDNGRFEMVEIGDGSYEVTFNNSYHTAPVSIDIVKIIDNKSGNSDISKAGFGFKAVQTDVEWKAIAGAETLIVYSDAEGQARLTATYTTTGTYHYIVTEINDGKTGWSRYSNAEYRVTVDVTPDSQNGGLKSSMTIVAADRTTVEGEIATVNGNSGTITFKNTYDPTDAIVNLNTISVVEKVLVGREMTDADAEKFIFNIYKDGEQQNALSTGRLVKQQDNSYKVVFDKNLDFAAVGTYHYDVREVNGGKTIDGVHYDPTIYDMVVEVTDDNGVLKANYFFEDATSDTVTFTNVYQVAGTATLDLSGLKTLKNHPLALGEFTFNMVVTEGDRIVRTTTTANHTGGEIQFPTITYTAANVGHTYTYTITEAVPVGAVGGVYQGITYDDEKYVITVKVVDDGKGGIILETTTDGVIISEDKTKATFTGLNFENTYQAKETTGLIVAVKQMDGRPLLNTDKFTFVVYEGDVKVAEAKNDGENILFEIKYGMKDVGEHIYEVREVKESVLGVHYDETIYKVIVHVVDDGLGQIHAYVTYADGDIRFTNVYKRENAVVELSGKKTLEGRKLVAGEFTFALYRADEEFNVIGEALRTATNDAEGNFTFNNGVFSTPGTYRYVIAEVEGNAGGVKYDKNEYHMEIKVEDNVNYDGKMSITVNIVDSNGKKISVTDTDGSVSVTGIVFNNTYTPDSAKVILEALKELVGRDLKAEEFTFEVKDEAGKVVATGKNDADGKIVFDEIKLAVGEYSYTISEVIGEEEDTIYDKTAYKVKVEVTDADKDGVLETKITYPEGGVKFINEHYEGVDTGDNSQMILWGAMAVLCVVAVGALVVIRKKMK